MTVEKTVKEYDEALFAELLKQGYQRKNKPARLIGIGVRFSRTAQ
jgi:hypothetical protein